MSQTSAKHLHCIVYFHLNNVCRPTAADASSSLVTSTAATLCGMSCDSFVRSIVTRGTLDDDENGGGGSGDDDGGGGLFSVSHMTEHVKRRLSRLMTLKVDDDNFRH
jgi:hypothetical protein